LREPLEIEVVDNLVSKAPVRQTLEVLRVCGIECDSGEDLLRFRVHPQGYRAGTFTVNGDWPGSAAVLAAAVATRSAIRIGGLLDDNQGERFAASALREMGALVEMDSDMEGAPGVRVAGAPLRGIEFDGDRATDAVLALVGAACFAAGKSRFHNVANLRIKECDRVSEPIAELRRIGVNCREGREAGDPDPDAIIVEGNPDGYEGGVEVDGRKDHRVIMLLATVGLGCRRGLRIRGAEHVAKSYPLFFRHLNELGADVRFEEAG
jgi:3-phosphoshikimate 1-carboxyvinyltransferase